MEFEALRMDGWMGRTLFGQTHQEFVGSDGSCREQEVWCWHGVQIFKSGFMGGNTSTENRNRCLAGIFWMPQSVGAQC